MQECPRLPAAYNVDPVAECFYQYIYGSKDIYYPHSHSFMEIFITVSGTVTHFCNGETQKLPEGSLVFMRPDDVHGYLYDDMQSRESSYINLAFSLETAHDLFAFLTDRFPSNRLLSCDMPPTVTLSQVEKNKLLDRIGELNIVNWQDKSALKIKMRALLADVFVSFFSDTPTTDRERIPHWLSRLFSEMERPENFSSGMDRMIELSGKTREHLARSVKKYYGITLAEYINELRINYAASLLSRTSTPIVDICYTCGFQNLGYFYKVFKKLRSVTPNAFRDAAIGS